MATCTPNPPNKKRGDTPVFDALLDLLAENKQMPQYAAERRLDLFINLFLEDILTARLGEKVSFVAPEFPLKVDSNNQSCKLDYLCVCDDTKRPIFVELKTDAMSFEDDQARFYLRHAELWPACVERLKKIMRARMPFSYRVKYLHLVKSLVRAELVDVGVGEFGLADNQVENLVAPRDKVRFSRAFLETLKNLSPCWPGAAQLVYLVPNDKNLKTRIRAACGRKALIIDFSEIGTIPASPGMKHRTEFRRLSRFLADLK